MVADFQDLRTKMVDNQIRTTDVTDLAVIDAFLTVPREAFVPASRQALAYIDEDQLLESEGPARVISWSLRPSPSLCSLPVSARAMSFSISAAHPAIRRLSFPNWLDRSSVWKAILACSRRNGASSGIRL